jgi:hypothetical protein
MLKQLVDRWWSWKRRRVEKTPADAYMRTAPPGAVPSGDPGINAHYARLREKRPPLTPYQQIAEQVRLQTIARAGDPPRKPDYVEQRSDHHGAGNIGHFAEPTARVTGMLPPIKGSDV